MPARALKPRLGVSACLLGQRVRYDSDHKLDRYIHDTLGRHVEFVPVCPEMAIGLGVPRPPIQLVGNPSSPRAVGVTDPALDVTSALAGFGRQTANALDDISGYVFKSRSPSCGMEAVKVRGRRGAVTTARGVYAAAFITAKPWLPVVEEVGLQNAETRAHFLEHVYAYHHWQRLLARPPSVRRLTAFHEAHTLMLMAHDGSRYRALARLAACRRESVAARHAYGTLFLRAIAKRATRAGHARALSQALRHLKPTLAPADARDLRASILAYAAGTAPWIAPAALLRYHARRQRDTWLKRQTYLYPEARVSAPAAQKRKRP